MYEQLLMSLNVVMPMAVLLGIGVLLRKTNVIDPAEMKPVDRMNFRLFTPMLLFKNICSANLTVALNPRTVLFIVCALMVSFACALILPARIIPDHRKAASVAQADKLYPARHHHRRGDLWSRQRRLYRTLRRADRPDAQCAGRDRAGA